MMLGRRILLEPTPGLVTMCMLCSSISAEWNVEPGWILEIQDGALASLPSGTWLHCLWWYTYGACWYTYGAC